ncbi:MAG: hypothetical protein ACYTEQ_27420, partial [Planctomycetota bacterium]
MLQLIDQWAGKGALGIYDITPTGQLKIEEGGKSITIDWDKLRDLREMSRREYVALGDLSREFIDSGLLPEDFIKTQGYYRQLAKIYDGWAKVSSDLPKAETVKHKGQVVQGVLGERIAARLTTPRVVQKWYETKQARAKTDAERKQLADTYKDAITQERLLNALKAFPRS